MEKNWRKSSRPSPAKKPKCLPSAKPRVIERLRDEVERQESWSDIFVLNPILNHMQAKAKQIVITTESHEVFVIRRDRRHAVRGFCPVCRTEVELRCADEGAMRQDPGEPDPLEHFVELAMKGHPES